MTAEPLHPYKQAGLVCENAPIPTWFGIGGHADCLVTPGSVSELIHALNSDGPVRVLGEGANLLVDDDGVDGVVLRLGSPTFKGVHIDASTGLVRVGAGTDLAKLIHATTKAGLSGLEGLGGVPATVGGALVMNAGGKYGEIGSSVLAVKGLDRQGRVVELHRREIPFSYRHSGLDGLVIIEAQLQLTPGDPAALRERYKAVMEEKSRSQPLKENSAGCVWKNPVLPTDIDGIAAAGTRVPAGMLIDRAGLKGLHCGGASVSEVHANFVVTAKGTQARASDVVGLMREVRRRVLDRYGVRLESEVVVWSRRGDGLDAV